MVKKISFTLLGGGYWGSKLAYEYNQFQKEIGNDQFSFIGIADTDKKRLLEIGNLLNLPTSMLFTDVEKCLRNQEIDAIHIATPSETHYNLANQGLLENKHILLEKPMALDSRSAFELQDWQKKMVGFSLCGLHL